jgi:hypothetical protein
METEGRCSLCSRDFDRRELRRSKVRDSQPYIHCRIFCWRVRVMSSTSLTPLTHPVIPLFPHLPQTLPLNTHSPLFFLFLILSRWLAMATTTSVSPAGRSFVPTLGRRMILPTAAMQGRLSGAHAQTFKRRHTSRIPLHLQSNNKTKRSTRFNRPPVPNSPCKGEATAWPIFIISAAWVPAQASQSLPSHLDTIRPLDTQHLCQNNPYYSADLRTTLDGMRWPLLRMRLARRRPGVSIPWDTYHRGIHPPSRHKNCAT